METEELVKPPGATSKQHIFSLLTRPVDWIRNLSSELSPSLVAGIFLVYGLSHGFATSYFRVVSDYYWKDVQHARPASAQFYVGLYYIPWIMRPIWGLLTDVLPIFGFRRRPYLVAAGIIGAVSSVVLAGVSDLPASGALVCMVGIAAGMAIASATIEACVAKNSIEVKELAADLQSLCQLCSSVGALLGFSCSGWLVHWLGAQIIERVSEAMENMYATIKFPQVWKPSLFMFLSLALSFSTHEGHFYWYTNPTAGPAFSQEFVGVIYAIGAVGSIFGVLIYQRFLKDFPFRSLLFYVQILYGVSGMLDLLFVLRWNLVLGIPDSLFIIMEESVLHIVFKIRWMPMMVLQTRLCPLGIEGTFFALLMCIDSIGSLSSKMIGGIVLHWLHITRTDFTYLWLAVLIRNCMRLGTLALIFLVPNATQHDVLVTSHQLSSKSGSEENIRAEEDDEMNVQLVPWKEKFEI